MKLNLIAAAIIALAAGLIVWGLTRERHEIQPLIPGETRTADGTTYIFDASVDGYVRKDGTLFDAYTPLTPGQTQLKDCKT